ncbi:MAG TPA: hypothetical protein VI136_09355 [Verrucomicrobiae bacterium]
MNSCCEKFRSTMAYVFAVAGAFLIVAALVWVTRKLVPPTALDEARVAERYKNLAEVRGADSQALTTVGWVDHAKGVVRLPMDTALKLTEREWQHPAQARSNLIARVEKATYVPPPPPPKPSQYE